LSNIKDLRDLLSLQFFKLDIENPRHKDLEMSPTQSATIADKIASSWPSAKDSKDDGYMFEMHVYRIHVYSEFAEGLVASDESLEDLMLLFRWSKIHAVYGQLGTASWKPDLTDILKEAEFRAGDGLKLSVLGVSEEQWDRYRLSGNSEMGSI
jgi:hypothetical protein